MVTDLSQEKLDSFINDRAAAKHLGVSSGYLRKLRRLGKGPKFYRVGGRLVRYRVSDLSAWASNHAIVPSHEVGN